MSWLDDNVAPRAPERAERAERANAVRAAIATLPDAEQQVVLLYYMSGQSHAVIAAFLGVTTNAVKTRLYGARQRLRAHMSAPLGWAAHHGHALMVEFLLRRGAKTRLPDDPPWATPLALATHRGHEHIVRLLTEYERTGTLPPRTRARFDALVADLMSAAGGGDDDALKRVAATFRVARPSFHWDHKPHAARVARLRRFLGEQLGKRGGPQLEHQVPTIEDARLFVARAHGYDSWTKLVEDVEKQ